MKWDELKHKKAKKEDKIQAHIHVISSLALESVCVCVCVCLNVTMYASGKTPLK